MKKMSKYEVVLFDLDGTLVNTSEGIFNSVRYAEKMMGFHPVSNEQLSSFVGPPPVQSYMANHKVTEEVAREATKHHREYGLKHGIYEAEVYEGIPKLLGLLKESGVKLGVCTLKRQDVAEKVLEHFGLLQYFDVVVGIDNQESLTKADTIDLALQAIHGTEKDEVVLVGDSVYDAEGAKEAQVDFIGVLYGFGLHKKQKDYYIVETVGELRDILCEEK